MKHLVDELSHYFKALQKKKKKERIKKEWGLKKATTCQPVIQKVQIKNKYCFCNKIKNLITI